MTNDNPRNLLLVVFCGSLIVYAAIAILLIPVLTPLLVVQENLITALFQGALVYTFLFLLFLLPSSFIYWRYRIDVKVIGPEPAAAEPDDEINLTVVIGLPGNASPKGAVLEAFLGDLVVAAQKVEASPTQLPLKVPDITPGYHKFEVKVSQLGYFSGSSSYELLIAPGEPSP
ncbi:MAG: hypothetical protein Q6364_01605 [Candidatus Hermodarchaeota archaeon]|nr:hypothetical protein [Candidatus Hermodarchaeota archaeon]